MSESARDRLEAWFEEQKANGLVSVSFTLDPAARANTSLEELLEEAVAMVTAPEFEPERREAFYKWLDCNPNYVQCDTCHSIRKYDDPCDHMVTIDCELHKKVIATKDNFCLGCFNKAQEATGATYANASRDVE